jgi:tetratricopeptide (TPR) repeat protein
MFDRETIISRINWNLSILATYLKLSSGQNLNSPAVLAEDFCVGLLNLLYGYNLCNANATMANASAVDLIDPAGRIAVQITVNDSTAKIRHTHRKASEHNLGDDFDKIILIFLVSKAPAEPKPSGNFTPCNHPAIEVRDLSSILGDIRGLGVARMTAIADLLDTEIQNPAKPWNRYANLRPANLPYHSLGTLFKGRGAFLADLHGRLTGHAATVIKGHAIHGLGGIGKTRASVEYAWRYQSHYTALLFVSADSPETLDTKLAALCHADVLNLPQKALTDQTEQKIAVLTWLNTHPGWLLILDNADTEVALTAVDQLLPRVAGGHALITSRMTDYAGGIGAVALDVLADDDAAAFLLERTADHRTLAPDDNARALELARELDGLALAMEQVAAHIRKERLSFAFYLDLWHTNTAAALHWYNARTMLYPRSLAVTYQTSVDQLSEPAKEFFRALSWLAPDPIPFFALEGDHAPANSRALLAELENLSLARRDTAGTSFTVHRLVQEITRQQQPAPPPPPALLIALDRINGMFPNEAGDVRTWPVAAVLAPHALAVALHAAAYEIRELSSRLMNQVAVFYQAKAQHHAAEPLMRQALFLAEAAFGKDHPIVAIALNNLADLLQDTNRPKEAEPLMRRALSIDETAFGPSHPNTATRLNNLAQLLRDTGRLEEAWPLLVRVFEISENKGGDPHPNFGAAMNSLALILQDFNQPKEAESLYRRALAFDENLFGPDHPHVANRLNNLATLLHVNNRLAEAEPLMRRGVEIEEKSKGKDHPHVAIHLSNLAQLLLDDNRLPEAEPLMRRMLEIFVSYTCGTGHRHQNLETGISNYRIILMEMGDTQAEANDKIGKILAPLPDLDQEDIITVIPNQESQMHTNKANS